MLGDLSFQRGLEDLLGQAAEQTTRSDQVDPFGPGLLHQPLRQCLLLILIEHHRLDRVGHDPCSLPTSPVGVSSQEPVTPLI
jgi:hypothetical protein